MTRKTVEQKIEDQQYQKVRLRLPRTFVIQLDNIAKQLGISRSKVAMRLMQDGINAAHKETAPKIKVVSSIQGLKQ